MNIKADFGYLIALLIEAQQLNNLNDQYALMERGLVAAELAGDPVAFYDTRHALGVLQSLELGERDWNAAIGELMEKS